MPRSHPPYPSEYRRQILELVRAGRSPEELAREFEPTAQTIKNWLKQADLDEGRRHDGLTTAERQELARLRRENKQLRLEREILAHRPDVLSGKAAAWFAQETGSIPPESTSSWRRTRPATRSPRCAAPKVDVSASGYYAWRKRSRSERARGDAILADRIRWIHLRSRRTYGALRIHAELADEGVRVGRKRVARLMRKAGLQGVSRRRRPQTTVRAVGAQPAPDLVERDFAVTGPNRLWVADITYVPTWSGFLPWCPAWVYLAVVVDAWSHRVVGWSMATHLRTELVLDALDMAIRRRHPAAVIHHSDQGSQPVLDRQVRIHVDRLRQALPGSGRAALHGIGGRLLR